MNHYAYVVMMSILAGCAVSGSPLNPSQQDTGIAAIINTEIILKEQGQYPGSGSEYTINEHGHPVTVRKVMESMRYIGWPTVAQTRDGRLFIAFSGDREAHICPWGKVQMVRSDGHGKAWSRPVTIMSTPLDDRDGGIIETREGTLLVSWFTSVLFSESPWSDPYVRHAEKITPEIREKWLGSWVCRSTDQGKTWQEPVRTFGGSPHGPIQLRDGRLLYVARSTSLQRIIVQESADDGCSWNLISSIPISDKITASALTIDEPHAVETEDGRLLVLIRHEDRKDPSRSFLLQSESEDGGQTWSDAHMTNIVGYPPHLVQLENGWLLVSYARRTPPYSQLACISRDGGKTWDVENEIVLSIAPVPDMGYPSSVQLKDKSILTVFYQVDKPGEKPCLMSTHWKFN